MITDSFEWLWQLFNNPVVYTAIVSFIVYLTRDTIRRFFTKTIEHQFERKLERFKAEIRDNEQQLDKIRSFLTSSRRERDSALQSKRLEAAEILLLQRNSISQLSNVVEYMQILNIEEIIKISEDPKVIAFISTIINPKYVDSKLSEIKGRDITLPRLYLSDETIKYFDAYESIVIQAATILRLLSVPLEGKARLIDQSKAREKIIEVIPKSKEIFDKYGDGQSYIWASFFHDNVLKSLRNEVLGVDSIQRDMESIELLELSSRHIQDSIQSSLEKAGLPDKLMNPAENIVQGS